MKKIILSLGILIFSTSSFSMDGKEFIDIFLEKIDHKLMDINSERVANGDKPFCSKFSTKQRSLIYTYMFQGISSDGLKAHYDDLSDVKVDTFVFDIGESIKCYPLGNLKASRMDRYLVRIALEEIAGRELLPEESLADLVK